MSTTYLKKVIIAGSSGELGRPLLEALLREPRIFEVTVLLRNNSTSSTPDGVHVVRLDYTDKPALIAAVRGHDVVLSVLGRAAQIENLEVTLLEAAVAAGVPRFIPSGFGGDVLHPTAVELQGVFAYKSGLLKLLKEKYRDQITYTDIITGVFLDWGLYTGFVGFDLAKKSAVIYDEGKHRFSGATLKTITEGVRGVLLHPAETRNRSVKIVDATTTQLEELALLEKYTATKWTITHKATAQMKKEGHEAWERGDFNTAEPLIILPFVYGGEGACTFEENDNELLGVIPISLEHIVKTVVEVSAS